MKHAGSVAIAVVALLVVAGCRSKDDKIGQELASASGQEIRMPDAEQGCADTLDPKSIPQAESHEKLAEVLRGLIVAGKFDIAHQLISDALKYNQRTRSGVPLFSSVSEELMDQESNAKELAGALDQWTARCRGSSVVFALRTLFYYEQAWRARGSRFQKDTSAEQMKKFEYRLEQAKQEASEALKLDPRHPLVLFAMIKLGRSTQMDEAEYQGYSKLAAELVPDNLPIHIEAMTRLTPQWGGSAEAALRYARETAAAAKPDSVLRRLVPMAHDAIAAVSGDKSAYFAQPGVWEESESHYSALIAAFPRSGRYPMLLAVMAKEANRLDVFRANFKLAFQREPNSPEILKEAKRAGYEP